MPRNKQINKNISAGKDNYLVSANEPEGPVPPNHTAVSHIPTLVCNFIPAENLTTYILNFYALRGITART